MTQRIVLRPNDEIPLVGAIQIVEVTNVGPPGPRGPQGIQGIQGPTGPQGADGADGAGILLAVKQYNPTTSVTFTRSNIAFADVSAANLAQEIIFPASGLILVRLTAACSVGNLNAGHYWNLRRTSGDISGTKAYATGSNQTTLSSVSILLSGTPGASEIIKWGFASSSGHTALLSVGQSGSFGPATMEFWDAGPYFGSPGSPGVPASGFYNYSQTVPSTSWVINHNLGFYPNVTAFDDQGRVIEAAEIHHTINQLELQLLTPRVGTARLS